MKCFNDFFCCFLFFSCLCFLFLFFSLFFFFLFSFFLFSFSFSFFSFSFFFFLFSFFLSFFFFPFFSVFSFLFRFFFYLSFLFFFFFVFFCFFLPFFKICFCYFARPTTMKVSKHTQNKQPPANHQVITPTANFSTDPAGAQGQTGRAHVLDSSARQYDDHFHFIVAAWRSSIPREGDSGRAWAAQAGWARQWIVPLWI